MSPPIITRQWLRENCSVRFEFHLKMQDGGMIGKTVINKSTGEPIGLSYSDRSYNLNKSNGTKAGTAVRSFCALDRDFDDLDAALDYLNESEKVAG